MALNRTHTLTMFRDNSDTNVVFSQTITEGVTHFHLDKVTDDTTRTVVTLSDDGFDLLQNWAAAADDMAPNEIIVSCEFDNYQLKIAPSKNYFGGLKFVKCAPGGKKTTIIVLNADQSSRFVAWVNRTK